MIRRVAHRRVALAVVLAASYSVRAAAAEYHVERRTVDDGLPQNSVNAILQTRDGYVWLATNGGLARFDGMRFVTFDVGNTPGMTSNRILSLCEDRDGSVWIGTENQGLMRMKDGVFTSFAGVEDLGNRAVASIIEARAGGLWMATATAIVRLEGGLFTSYRSGRELPAGIVPWSRSMIEDRRGDLWAALDGGLLRLTPEGATLFTSRDGLPSDEVHAVGEARDGGLWVGTERGLARFRDGSFSTYTRRDGLASDNVACIVEDRSGSLWIGTDGGAARLDGGGWTTITAADGLSSNGVSSIMEDREGSVWLGTADGGINWLRGKQLGSYTEADGLPVASIVPIVEDRAGDVWMGATCGGLIRFHTGRFTTYGMADGLPNNCVWALCADRDGSLWIGTWGGGLTHLENGRFTTYTPDNSGLSGKVVKAIWQGPDGSLWVGTDYGLNRLRDGEFAAWSTKHGLINDRIHLVTGDSRGAIWICTNGGVSRFENGAFTNYTEADGLSHVNVRAIYEDAEGTLWMGTYGGGLNRFKDGRFTRYGMRHGLFDDTVSQILEDAQGNLWTSGNKGISRLSKDELNEFAEGRRATINAISYGVADGMVSRECNGGGQPAGCKTRAGELWFPTIKGPVVVAPDRIRTNSLPPPVAVEEVLVDAEAADPRGDVELVPGRGDLEVHYTALSFVAPEKVRFRYVLEGYDDVWVEAGTRRVAYFTNIPPGRYTFRVMAANADGVWNETGAAFSFFLRPRFYQTWWFYALAGVGLAGLVALLFRRRVRALRRANAVQRAFSRQLIQAQETERKRIAAELHDSIGQSLAIIRNLALMSLNAPDDHEQAIEQLEEVSTAASEALVEVRSIAHNLRPYQLDRLGLSRAIEAMVRSVAESTEIALTAEIVELDGCLTKEAEINLYRIVQESVSNVIRHAEATEARVLVEKDARAVRVEVRDDGRGFTPGPSAGLGLVGIAERARILGAACEIRSAPGKGTTVAVTVPLKEPPDEE